MDSITYSHLLTGLCTAVCTTNRKNRLLDRFACLRERGGQSLCYVARLVLDKLPEPGGNVCLCDVDVIPGGH